MLNNEPGKLDLGSVDWLAELKSDDDNTEFGTGLLNNEDVGGCGGGCGVAVENGKEEKGEKLDGVRAVVVGFWTGAGC